MFIFYFILQIYQILFFQKIFFFKILDNNRLSYKLKQTNNSNIYISNNRFTQITMFSNFLAGFKYLWLGLRFWILPIFVFFLCFFFLSFIKMVPFYKFTFIIFIISSFSYWLFSGFVFFIKKYQYRYYTSSIQRFWKRCFSIFWMLEFFLFSIFVYLVFMASQENFFILDNSQIFKTHLFSWRYFLLKIFPTTMIIIFIYFLLISLKWNTFPKLNIFIIIISFLILLLLWVEFNQFFHIVSYYGNLNWKYEDDENYWFLENEFKRTRINNHFLTIALIAKFWHVVFAVVFWLFFVLRGLELSRIRYSFLTANLQNFVLIYILSWLYMYPWFKYVFLKLFNVPYYWFYVNNKRLLTYVFYNDLEFFYTNIFNDFFFFLKFFFYKNVAFTDFNNFFSQIDFFYFFTSSESTSFTQFNKNFIKDIFLKKYF